MLADLFAPARRLELVDAQIHGDRGACVSHLSLNSNGVKAALGYVGAVRVAQVVERTLRDAGRIETRGFGRFVSPRVATLR